jgi:hypothetical protein
MKVAALWPARHKLLTVIVDESGRSGAPIDAARTRESASALITWLDMTVDVLVLSDAHDALVELARAASSLTLELAPHELLEAIRRVAGFTHRPQRDTAAFLARWPLTPALRRHLRRSPSATPGRNRDQLPLL